MMLRLWLLAFPGWGSVQVTDGALAVIAPHIRQLRQVL